MLPRKRARADAKQIGGLADVEQAVSPGTMYQWAYLRKIPTVKIMGGALRFRQSTLEKLIAKWERPALRPLNEFDGSS